MKISAVFEIIDVNYFNGNYHNDHAYFSYPIYMSKQLIQDVSVQRLMSICVTTVPFLFEQLFPELITLSMERMNRQVVLILSLPKITSTATVSKNNSIVLTISALTYSYARALNFGVLFHLFMLYWR